MSDSEVEFLYTSHPVKKNRGTSDSRKQQRARPRHQVVLPDRASSSGTQSIDVNQHTQLQTQQKTSLKQAPKRPSEQSGNGKHDVRSSDSQTLQQTQRRQLHNAPQSGTTRNQDNYGNDGLKPRPRRTARKSTGKTLPRHQKNPNGPRWRWRNVNSPSRRRDQLHTTAAGALFNGRSPPNFVDLANDDESSVEEVATLATASIPYARAAGVGRSKFQPICLSSDEDDDDDVEEIATSNEQNAAMTSSRPTHMQVYSSDSEGTANTFSFSDSDSEEKKPAATGTPAKQATLTATAKDANGTGTSTFDNATETPRHRVFASKSAAKSLPPSIPAPSETSRSNNTAVGAAASNRFDFDSSDDEMAMRHEMKSQPNTKENKALPDSSMQSEKPQASMRVIDTDNQVNHSLRNENEGQVKDKTKDATGAREAAPPGKLLPYRSASEESFSSSEGDFSSVSSREVLSPRHHERSQEQSLQRNSLSEISIHDESDFGSDIDVEYEDEDTPLPPCASFATSHKYKGENGLPRWDFSVYSGIDDVIYDFSAYAAQSSIPNAGHGAFLTYRGARVLKPECREPSSSIIRRSKIVEAPTMRPLVAQMPNGRTAVVTLSGSNLHGNFDSVYWPSRPPRVKTFDRSEGLQGRTGRGRSSLFQSKNIRVKLVGDCLLSHRELSQRTVDGFGYLGLFTANDFKSAEDAPFLANISIDLGTYGPLSPSDRKQHFVFDCKSFIFCSEPGEWAYSVEEELMNCPQLVDITSDVTGTPHEAARSELPMYVNETGYDRTKDQNVFVGEVHCRTVHYFFRAGDRMNKGDTVELLTNYRSSYERVRERKGYGLKNLYRQDKTDEDLASRFRRNLYERSRVEEKVGEMSLADIQTTLDYIMTHIWNPLKDMTDSWYTRPNRKTVDASPLTSLQWRALLRCTWLARTFSKRVEHLEKSSMMDAKMKAVKEELRSIRIPVAFNTTTLLSNSLRDSAGNDICGAVLEEVTEEFCFETRHKLRLPFNKSYWCDVSIRLLEDLCKSVAQWKFDSRIGVLDAMYGRIRAGMIEIEQLSVQGGAALKDLTLDGGIDFKTIPEAPFAKVVSSLKTLECFSFLGNDKVPKVVSSLAVASLIGGPRPEEPSMYQQNTGERFLMTQFSSYRGTKYAEFASYPQKFDQAVFAHTVPVNVAWYRIWQVLYVSYFVVMHVFGEDEANLALAKLCSSFELDISFAKVAISHGMQRCRWPELAVLLREMVTFENAAFEHSAAECRRETLRRMKLLNVRASRRDRDTERLLDHLLKVAGEKKVQCCEGNTTTRGAGSKKRKRDEQGVSSSGDRKNVKRRSETRKPDKVVEQRTKTLKGKKGTPIYEGKPTTPLADGKKWPDGWIQKTYVRISGASAGHSDDYFFSPQLKVRLRSKRDVLRFLDKLERSGGDENAVVGAKFKPA